jgi:hypothetical protein
MRISLQNNRWRFYILRDIKYNGWLFLSCGIWHDEILMGFNLGFAARLSSLSLEYSVHGAWEGTYAVSSDDEEAAIAELVRQGLLAIERDTVSQKELIELHATSNTVTVLTHVVPDVYYIDSWVGGPDRVCRRQ